MARRQARKKEMIPAEEPKLKPVRLDLARDEHRPPRLVSYHKDRSIADFTRDALVKLLREKAQRAGIKA